MSIQPTDEFLVNRGGNSYSVQSQNLMSIQDSDLLLVNRSNKSYKVTGQEVKDSVVSKTPPTIASVTLTDENVSLDRFTNEQFKTTITMSDDQNSTKQLDYYVTGSLNTISTVPISTNNISQLPQERTLIQSGNITPYSSMGNPVWACQKPDGSVWVFSSSTLDIVGILDGTKDNVVRRPQAQVSATFNDNGFSHAFFDEDTDQFIVTGSQNKVYVSSDDCQTFEQVPIPSTSTWSNVKAVHKAFGKYIFVGEYISQSNKILVWDDLNGTNERTTDMRFDGQSRFDFYYKSVAYNGECLVIGGQGEKDYECTAYYTKDLITWNEVNGLQSSGSLLGVQKYFTTRGCDYDPYRKLFVIACDKFDNTATHFFSKDGINFNPFPEINQMADYKQSPGAVSYDPYGLYFGGYTQPYSLEYVTGDVEAIQYNLTHPHIENDYTVNKNNHYRSEFKCFYDKSKDQSIFVTLTRWTSSNHPDLFHTWRHDPAVAQFLNVDPSVSGSLVEGQYLRTKEPLITDTVSSASENGSVTTLNFSGSKNVRELLPGRRYYSTSQTVTDTSAGVAEEIKRVTKRTYQYAVHPRTGLIVRGFFNSTTTIGLEYLEPGAIDFESVYMSSSPSSAGKSFAKEISFLQFNEYLDKFVAINNDWKDRTTSLWFSEDGKSWTSRKAEKWKSVNTKPNNSSCWVPAHDGGYVAAVRIIPTGYNDAVAHISVDGKFNAYPLQYNGSGGYASVVWVGAPYNYYLAATKSASSANSLRSFTKSYDLMSWTKLKAAPDSIFSNTFQMITTPELSSRIFAFEYSNRFYSDDGGETWTKDNNVFPNSQYSQYTQMPHVIWLPQYQKYFTFAKNGQIFSTSDGLTWQQETSQNITGSSGENGPPVYDAYTDSFICYNNIDAKFYRYRHFTDNKVKSGIHVSSTSNSANFNSTIGTWSSGGELTDSNQWKAGYILSTSPSSGNIAITGGGMPQNSVLETDLEPSSRFLSYVEADGNGNVTGFANSPKPIFINDGSNTNTIQFPSMIGSNSPDTQLPPGSTLNVEVSAYNAGGFSETLTDNVTPGDGSTTTLAFFDTPISINGYYPLYTTQEQANAAGNGTSHEHEIDGITYYMPDSGVDIYHGDFDPNSY